MMKYPPHLIVFIILLLFCVACRSEPEVIIVTVQVEQEVIITDTVIVTATPSDSNAQAEAPPVEVDEPTAEPTATLAPVQATQQALLALVPTQAPSEEETVAEDDYVGIVDQACDIVQENYVRDNFNGVDWTAVCESYHSQAAGIPDSEALWELLGNMIGELHDNHSRFVSPSNFAVEFNLPTEGSGRPWPGMTIWPAREDEHVILWDVCRNGPAASAGLQRGDMIVSISGVVPTRNENGFSNDEINELLYGNNARSATFVVRRGPNLEPEEIDLQYGGANGCDGWGSGLLSETPRIGYIRVPDFGGNSNTNIFDAITRLEENGVLDGLVVDVRHNGGGNADRDIAIFTTGIFGKVGSIRSDATQTIYRIRGPVRWNEETPVAVLIDGNSHSAAEYFATAMQQSGRAVLVGTPTAGNTEGIISFNLAGGLLMRLAISTLELPDGSTLEGIGVQPDIAVPLGEFGLREDADVQLEAAYTAVTQ